MIERASARAAERPSSGALAGTASPPHDLTTSRGLRVGILAGNGRLPLAIAESVVARGGSAHIVAIEGEADADIARFPHTWVNWGHVGRMVATLRREADALVIVGSVRRPNLWKVRPDWGFILSLPKILEMMVGGDDSVLSRVVRFFEAKGIEVRGAHEVAPDLLAPAGPAGALALDAEAQADAELGFAVRAALGPLDAGQAVVVAGGRVLAIEGAEGTDRMLARVRHLREGRAGAARSGVLSKGPKPGQELRVDMPTIGPRTVEGVAGAGLAGVAVEAGAVLLLDRDQAVRAADGSGIAIEGLATVPLRRTALTPATARPARFIGPRRPNARAEADSGKALAAVRCLLPFATGQAVVVARAYILAIAAAEPAPVMLDRTRALRQWGVGAKQRLGVVACHAGVGEWDETGVASLLDRAAAAGLAGVTVTGPPAALAAFEGAGDSADRHELFVALREELP
jgi:UDP-2,3-diacylglucosamine hydrolase